MTPAEQRERDAGIADEVAREERRRADWWAERYGQNSSVHNHAVAVAEEIARRIREG